jgi:N-acetylglucosamine-6-phosphate deacetylase
MILTNARCIFPDGIRAGLEVVVQGGKIAELHPENSRAAHEVIDLAGNYLAPGFVDLHIHGAIGRDTMEGTEEAFRAVCDYHATGGTTSLLLTTTTAPVKVIVHVLEQIRGGACRRAFYFQGQSGRAARQPDSKADGESLPTIARE